MRALGFARPGLGRGGHLHVAGHSRHSHADVLAAVVQPCADFRDVDDVVSGRGAGDDRGRGEAREGQPESLAHPSFARVRVREVDRPGAPAGRGAFPGAFRSLLNSLLDGSRSPRRGEDPEPARRGEGEDHRLKGLRGGAFDGSGRRACATMTPRGCPFRRESSASGRVRHSLIGTETFLTCHRRVIIPIFRRSRRFSHYFTVHGCAFIFAFEIFPCKEIIHEMTVPL